MVKAIARQIFSSFISTIELSYFMRATIMEGVQFLVNEEGEKTAVLIDLNEWGDLWEDFYDIMISRSRQDEAEVSWDELKAELELNE
jgi:hypothetical protein